MTDPYDRSLGLALGRPTAEIVTVSHQSPHHSNVEAVGGEPRVLRGPGEYEIGGVMIAGVATTGKRGDDGSNGPNTAFSIEIDDIIVCHLGDLGKTLNASQIEALKDPDVLLIPVGGGNTIGPAEVAEVVSQLEPKIVVPMHYALPGMVTKLETLERFSREMGVQELHPQPKLAVTRGSLPSETTVMVLETTALKK